MKAVSRATVFQEMDEGLAAMISKKLLLYGSLIMARPVPMVARMSTEPENSRVRLV